MKNVLTALLLFLVMLFSPVTTLASWEFQEKADPATAEAEELVYNGDFEILNAEKDGPDGWHPYPDPDVKTWRNNPVSKFTKERAHSGKYSVKIDQSSSNLHYSYISQNIEGLQKGITYQVSYWVYATTDEEEIRFYYETWKPEEYFIPGYDNNGSEATDTIVLPKGKWTQVFYNFNPIIESDYTTVFCWVINGEGVYFDDVSVKMIKEPEFATFDTNQVLYYTDLDEGFATTEVHPYFTENVKEWTVTYQLKDGDTVLQESGKMKFEGLISEWIFNPKLMTDKTKDYTLSMVLNDKDGNIQMTDSKRVCRVYDRPPCITKDGRILNDDGEIFLPLGAYNVQDNIDGEEIYDEVARMGTTYIEDLYGDRYLDDQELAIDRLDYLYKKGFKVMVNLFAGFTITSSPEIAERAKKLVEAVKDHPAVFGYNIGDEPISKNFTDEELETAYRLVRDIDPIHPIYLCDQKMTQYKRLSKFSDIVGADSYNYIACYNTTYYEYVWKHNAPYAQRAGKPAMLILQTFKSPNARFPKYPTPDEMRNIIYQSLFNGVTAFSIYTYEANKEMGLEDGIRFFEDHPLGDAIEAWFRDERPLAEDYFLKKLYPTFMSGQTKEYSYRAFVKDDEVHVIVLNRSETEPVELDMELISNSGKVTIPSFSGKILYGSAEGNGETISGKDGRLKATIGAAEAVYFTLKPEAKIDTTLLVVEKEPEKAAIEDIADYSWAKEAIEMLYGEDIVLLPEEGKYLPGSPITRGDFAMYLVRALGLTEETEEGFADVPEDAVYKKELAIGKKAGILNGIGNNNFAPENKISRQDLMTMVARGLKLSGDADLTVFSDSDKVADYALESVSAMIANEIIEGNADGTLNPLGNTTRAEAAVIISRIYNR